MGLKLSLVLRSLLWENGGTWSVTRILFQYGTDTQPRAESHSLRMKDVSVGWAILTWFLDVFLSWEDISAEEDEDLPRG